MGIPKFYRWLSERYPLINQKIDGPICPEFDCMYLDMNGIFHNCSHGRGVSANITNAQMYTNIFKYINFLVELAKPKKILYMAVDGVAPRAKMNQQRKRRFISAKDQKLDLAEFKKKGVVNVDKLFDSNSITPGTTWMQNLSEQLLLFIRKQMSENGLWKNLKVIYSDHLTPGEGEHKIMDYIRNMKMQPAYNPNTTHCLYGLDADLIMLSLVSHEIHFCLLREKVLFGLQNQQNNSSADDTEERMLTKKHHNAYTYHQPFQLLHLTVLRNYLNLEFKELSLRQKLPFAYDFERVINDFVFICMLIGNDFIPSLPSVNIGSNGMENLFQSYKRVLPRLSGYLLNHDLTINIKHCRVLFAELANNEILNFEKQLTRLKSYRTREHSNPYPIYRLTFVDLNEHTRKLSIDDIEYYLELIEGYRDIMDTYTVEEQVRYENEDANDELKAEEDNINKNMTTFDNIHIDVHANSNTNGNTNTNGHGYDGNGNGTRMTNEPPPLNFASKQEKDAYLNSRDLKNVRHFRELYYLHRWPNGEMSNLHSRQQLCLDYLYALQWNIYYYFHGCQSFRYYYPHHYAPLVSDMAFILEDELHNHLVFDRIGKHKNGQKDETDIPFKPYEQLLSVLPIASNKVLPEAYQRLMTEPQSCIHSFYPTEFAIDMNLQTVSWMSVALLPFIDEQLLRKAIANNVDAEMDLTLAERTINGVSKPVILEYNPRKIMLNNARNAAKSAVHANVNQNQKKSGSSSRSRIAGPDGFEQMPDLIAVETWHLPAIPSTSSNKVAQFEPYPRPNASPILPGFPNVFAFQFDQYFNRIPVKTFGFASNFETLVLKMKNIGLEPEMLQYLSEDQQYNLLQDRAYHFLDQYCVQYDSLFVGWPYFREAKLVCVVMNDCIFDVSANQSNGGSRTYKRKQSNQQSVQWFYEKADQLKKDYLYTVGVELPDIHAFIKVMPLISMKRQLDRKTGVTQIVQEFSQRPKYYPMQLALLQQPLHNNSNGNNSGAENNNALLIDSRFLSQYNIDRNPEFKKGVSVMYIGPNDTYYGKYGRVTNKYEAAFVDIRVIDRWGQSDFAQRIIANDNAQTQVRYYSENEICHKLNLNKKMFFRLCSSLMIRSKPRDIEIGLGLKFWKKQVYMPDYVRVVKQPARQRNNYYNNKGNNNKKAAFDYIFEYSDKAVQLFIDFETAFPGLFALMNAKFHQKVLYADAFCLPELNAYLPMNQQMTERDLFGESDTDSNDAAPDNNQNNAARSNAKDANEPLRSTDQVLAELQKECGQMSLQVSADASASAPMDSSTNSKTHDAENHNIENESGTIMEFAEAAMNKSKTKKKRNDNETDSSASDGGHKDYFVKKINSNRMDAAIEQIVSRTSQRQKNVARHQIMTNARKKFQGKEYLMKVKQWIKTQEVSKLPLVDFDAICLSNEVIKEIELASNQYYLNEKQLIPKAYHLKRTPIAHVYISNPRPHWSPDGNPSTKQNQKQKQTQHGCYRLGDRIASIRSDFGVPFGTRGTIVGLHDTFVEIVTDKAVIRGTTLNNRCSDHRGVILAYDSILNLTNRRMSESGSASNSNVRQNHNSNNNYGNRNNNKYYNNSNNNQNNNHNHNNNNNNNYPVHNKQQYANPKKYSKNTKFNNNNNNNRRGKHPQQPPNQQMAPQQQYGYRNSNNNQNNNGGDNNNYQNQHQTQYPEQANFVQQQQSQLQQLQQMRKTYDYNMTQYYNNHNANANANANIVNENSHANDAFPNPWTESVLYEQNHNVGNANNNKQQSGSGQQWKAKQHKK